MNIRPEDLGSAAFRAAHRARYAYVAGSMYKGIASKELVARMARASLPSYLGAGGMKLERLAADIQWIREQVPADAVWGVNLLCNLMQPEAEERTVDLLLANRIQRIEAAAFMQITPALVRYRATGLVPRPDGTIECRHRVLAKVSRTEVAEPFLRPPSARLLARLVERGQLTADIARLAEQVPMADDICVEADSAGHTDQGVAWVMVPTMLELRARVAAEQPSAATVTMGTAGGLGTPAAIAAAFTLGADFVLTGSVNQCTVEAGISDAAKDMLQSAEIHDTTMVPAGDMFEIGARAQVFKRGVFFPARANKLYELYRQHGAWDDIDEATRRQIETKYFKRSVADVWAETRAHYLKTSPADVDKAEQNPKHKLALIFRWYFVHTGRLALKGIESERVDFQIHCGPALGAFNAWVRGTPLESWRARHVDDIAERLMVGAAAVLSERCAQWGRSSG